MIYFITGTPGAGKTAAVVDMILTNHEGLFAHDDGTPRPLYYCHIDGFDKGFFRAHELTEAEIQAAPLRDIIPVGSVLIVDEADYTYPLRPPSRPVPPYVQTLKELRHEGFTLILMTQHPTMLDPYVRKLIGKHIHLERKMVGTKRYEWFRCHETLTPADFAAASGRWYTPSKKAFKYYKSATKHIKFKKKLHGVFYALPVLALLLAYFLYGIYGRFQEQTQPAVQAASHAQSAADASLQPLPPSERTPEEIKRDLLTPQDYAPRIANMQETAPIYDDVRRVADFPQMVGCIAAKNTCRCYSQQATVLAGISKEECLNYVDSPPFNPYKEAPREGFKTADSFAPDKSDSVPLVATLGTEPKTDLAKPPNINLAR